MVELDNLGGRRKGVKLADDNQTTQRKLLRGRRRGVKEAKVKEDKVLALQMERWLVAKPPSN